MKDTSAAPKNPPQSARESVLSGGASCNFHRSGTMVATDKLFAGSIPEIYDRFFVPLLFEAYASDLAERLARAKPRDVLETAAGTGVLTRAIAARLPADTHIVATDLNQTMIDLAATRQTEDRRITWRQADALRL